MIKKSKLIVILVIIFITPRCFAYIPKPLSSSDQETYKKIFDFQENGDFNSADKLIKIIEDDILMGRVLAQRYLDPKSYISKFSELKDWLKKYNDHPSASRIYWLSKRKKPKSAPLPQKPTPGYLSGFGGLDNERIRPSIPLSFSGRSAPSVTREIARKIRRYIRRGWPSGALEVLNTSRAKKYLTNKEEAQLHWEIANAYFIFNKDLEAITQASKSLKISNGKFDYGWFTAGLASWRRGDLKRAEMFFNNLADLKEARDFIRASGAYWGSRVALEKNDPKRAIQLLKIGANFQDTFYGQLSIAALGQKNNLDFDLPEVSKDFMSWLYNQKGGKRAFGLIQVGEYWHAERELRKLYPRTPKNYHIQLMTFAAQNGMPSLSYRLADIQRNETGINWYGALYPHFIFQNETNFLDNSLILSIVRQESRFDQRGKSPAKAQGLMQILPSTAAFIMRDKNYRSGKLRHDLLIPEVSFNIGEKYLEHLLNEPIVNHNVIKMLAAYNGGPGNLNKWIKKTNFDNDPLLFIESLPSRETRGYIKSVLKNLYIYRSKFNKTIPEIEIISSGAWPIKKDFEIIDMF